MEHKIYCIFGFLLFVSANVFAQDLVVTNDGDSLNVEIVKVDAESIHFLKFEPKKQRITLNKSEVKSFQYIFFSQERKTNYFFDPNDTRFKVGLSGGVSVVLSGADRDASDFFKQYVRQVNAGWHGKIEADYYLPNNIGFGLVYDRYMTSGFEPNVIFINQAQDTIVGELSDKIHINYLGPQVSFNIDTKKEGYTAFIAGGPGIMFYKDRLKRVDPFVATGTAIGVHLSAGLDFVLSDNITMGFELSGTFGALNSYDLKSDSGVETINEKEDISRINISVGIRYFR